MKFPKVQKYCLLSVAGCWTDFHVDFGGTSVWYHVLSGEKIFYFSPPTDENLQRFEVWTMSGRQGDVFLGDVLSGCERVVVSAGMTLFLPCGWIHAVYTPRDTIVFGGNFIHSFQIQQQLEIFDLEQRIRVHRKFTYPLYKELSWYVVARYARELLGRDFLTPITDSPSPIVADLPQVANAACYLCTREIDGLLRLIDWLLLLPPSKISLPSRLPPDNSTILAKTLKNHLTYVTKMPTNSTQENLTAKPLLRGYENAVIEKKPVLSKVNEERPLSVRERSRRCGNCSTCRGACGKCRGCTSRTNFADKCKPCEKRDPCVRPLLSDTCKCSVCDSSDQRSSSSVMECQTCKSLNHPICLAKKGIKVFEKAKILPEMAQLWICPTCNDPAPASTKSKRPAISPSASASSTQSGASTSSGAAKQHRATNPKRRKVSAPVVKGEPVGDTNGGNDDNTCATATQPPPPSPPAASINDGAGDDTSNSNTSPSPLMANDVHVVNSGSSASSVISTRQNRQEMFCQTEERNATVDSKSSQTHRLNSHITKWCHRKKNLNDIEYRIVGDFIENVLGLSAESTLSGLCHIRPVLRIEEDPRVQCIGSADATAAAAASSSRLSIVEERPFPLGLAMEYYRHLQKTRSSREASASSSRTSPQQANPQSIPTNGIHKHLLTTSRLTVAEDNDDSSSLNSLDED